jgi:hypothetical protein
MVILQPCVNRLNSFNLLKISARYARCCYTRTPEKGFANGVPVADRKRNAVLSSTETQSTKS